MKVVIIGGVAAGTKTAAKLKRENSDAEIVIYAKSSDISYAGCGLPYYVGGSILSRKSLVVNTPESFENLTGVKVNIDSEVTDISVKDKTITVNDEVVSYDKLVIAVGAHPFVPPIEGVNKRGVFTVRTPDDAVNIRNYMDMCKTAVVVGGGFIGLEMAENLMSKGIKVTLVDMADQIMPNVFDKDMAEYVCGQLHARGLNIYLSSALKSINGDEKVTSVTTSDGNVQADMVILSVGIKPSTEFLKDSGIEMDRGLILTDETGKTNVEDIYSVGDCAMVKNRLTGKRQWSAMGSTANIAGKCLALTLSGDKTNYEGCLGTGVVKVSCDINAGRTGLTEKQARLEGYDVITATSVCDDKAHYYPGSSIFVTKLIADKTTHKLLGMQVVGKGAVDKMTDIAVVGITAGLKVEDFINMDFAYAPPFSTAIHPFAQAIGVLYNKITGRMDSVTPLEYMEGMASDYEVIDALPYPSLQGKDWIDLNDIEAFTARHKKDEKLLLVCVRGKRGYLSHRKLKAAGYTNTKVLEGGVTLNYIK